MGSLTWQTDPVPAPQASWRAAMELALYGPSGFYRTQSPSAHFRTAPTASPLFAEAVHRLAQAFEFRSIVDVGAGEGKLLQQLHVLDPALDLTGIELRARPDDLPESIGWQPDLPEHIDGLVLANEWLDNIPLDLTDGTSRLAVDGTALPLSAADAAWLRDWWPEGPAELGRPRDEAWAEVVRRIEHGLAVAIDYGHVRADRPSGYTLTGYRQGRQVDPVPDGSCDITAHVAVDSCLAAGSAVAGSAGCLVRQRKALRALQISGARPPVDLARTDPAAYLHRLSRAAEGGELTDPAGLGDFWWILQPVGLHFPADLERRMQD